MKTKIFATTDPCDEKKLNSYITSLQNQNVKNIHFDVMDGLFVEAKKISPKTILGLTNSFAGINFDVHLMVQNPAAFVKKLTSANVKNVFAHIESLNTDEEIDSFISECKKNKFSPGVAISPKTALTKKTLCRVSQFKNVLVMGVIPGKSGQKLILSTINKVKKLKEQLPKMGISFDGGVNENNISKVKQAGATSICLGSVMFKKNQLGEVKNFLKKIANL